MNRKIMKDDKNWERLTDEANSFMRDRVESFIKLSFKWEHEKVFEWLVIELWDEKIAYIVYMKIVETSVEFMRK